MNIDTGEIIKLQEAKEKENNLKKFVEIPEKYIGMMESMGRRDRRKFYRDHKKEFKKVKDLK